MTDKNEGVILIFPEANTKFPITAQGWKFFFHKERVNSWKYYSIFLIGKPKRRRKETTYNISTKLGAKFQI